MSPLQTNFNEYRQASHTKCEKGDYFEELITTYLRYKAAYSDLYRDV
jgi:hypothetical protein